MDIPRNIGCCDHIDKIFCRNKAYGKFTLAVSVNAVAGAVTGSIDLESDGSGSGICSLLAYRRRDIAGCFRKNDVAKLRPASVIYVAGITVALIPYRNIVKSCFGLVDSLRNAEAVVCRIIVVVRPEISAVNIVCSSSSVRESCIRCLCPLGKAFHIGTVRLIGCIVHGYDVFAVRKLRTYGIAICCVEVSAVRSGLHRAPCVPAAVIGHFRICRSGRCKTHSKCGNGHQYGKKYRYDSCFPFNHNVLL